MPVKIVDPELLKCMERFEDVLKTNEELSMEDVHFASRVFCKIEYNTQQLTWILLFLNRVTTTGRYAFNLHHDLMLKISNRDEKGIIMNYKNPSRELFIELVDNPYLNEEEKNKINNILEREFNILKECLENQEQQDDIPFITGCNRDCYSRYDSKKGYISSSSLYTGIYSRHCLENNILSSPVSPQSIQFIDRNPNQQYQIYQIPIKDLLPLLIEENGINPYTGSPITVKSLSQLKEKLNIEIKLYKRFLEQISKH